MITGNEPLDNGNYLFATEEKNLLLNLSLIQKHGFDAGWEARNSLTISNVGVYGRVIVVLQRYVICQKQ
jgi:hypothetical protein